MNKKNDKRLCWNCDGEVAHHLLQCPFCGADVTRPKPTEEDQRFHGFASPFQSASNQDIIPQPPYFRTSPQDLAVTDDEWNNVLNEEKKEGADAKEEDASQTTKKEMIALLLLLPGIVFFLFGIAVFFFSQDGVLSLSWHQNVAYYYFAGAVPLVYLGWRALR